MYLDGFHLLVEIVRMLVENQNWKERLEVCGERIVVNYVVREEE